MSLSLEVEQRSSPGIRTGFIYQAFAQPGCFDGHYANIGAWMVDDSCCGMGIREDRSLVISNQSRFVPHFFE
jgi:glutathionylspermidine synthase